MSFRINLDNHVLILPEKKEDNTHKKKHLAGIVPIVEMEALRGHVELMLTLTLIGLVIIARAFLMGGWAS